MDKDKIILTLGALLFGCLLVITFFLGRGWEQARVIQLDNSLLEHQNRLTRVQQFIQNVEWPPHYVKGWQALGFTIPPKQAKDDSLASN